MSENSKIEWTDHTFNPWIGCAKVAPGCVNCYAEADFDKRLHVAQWGPHGTRIVTSPANWAKPLKWHRDAACTCNKPIGQSSMEAFATCSQHRPSGRPRVFCASLADVFEDWSGPILDHKGQELVRFGNHVEVKSIAFRGKEDRLVTLDDIRRDLFALIDATPNLDWLLLTKRPGNVLRMWTPPHRDGRGNAMDHAKTAEILRSEHPHLAAEWLARPNVWLGTSISDQATADKAIPELLKCRSLCPVLFLSAEPLLGPVMLHHRIDANGVFHHSQGVDVDWVIVGGESGHSARPCNHTWVGGIVSQCSAAGVPCFVKQLGSVWVRDDHRIPNSAITSDMSPTDELQPFKPTHPKGGDISQFPHDLRVRQFPLGESVVYP